MVPARLPTGRGGPGAVLGPLVCSITGPRLTSVLCTVHGLVCLWEEFDLDLDSCGTVRDLWTDWALAGCCSLASVSDSFLTEILFFASDGLSTCRQRSVPPAEALAGSHPRFLWGHLLRDHPLSVSSGEQEVGPGLVESTLWAFWPVLLYPSSVPKSTPPPQPGALVPWSPLAPCLSRWEWRWKVLAALV